MAVCRSRTYNGMVLDVLRWIKQQTDSMQKRSCNRNVIKTTPFESHNDIGSTYSPMSVSVWKNKRIRCMAVVVALIDMIGIECAAHACSIPRRSTQVQTGAVEPVERPKERGLSFLCVLREKFIQCTLSVHKAKEKHFGLRAEQRFQLCFHRYEFGRTISATERLLARTLLCMSSLAISPRASVLRV